MKAVYIFSALASSGIARAAKLPRDVVDFNVKGHTGHTATTTEVTSTYTSDCEVTVTKTEDGTTYTDVYTTTSVVETVIPTTIYDYKTIDYTKNVTSEVYKTESCTETFYTTISANSTITIPTTITNTVEATAFYTITATSHPPTTVATVVVPLTQFTKIPVYQTVIFPKNETATASTTVVITEEYTIFTTTEPPTTKATVLVPITVSTSTPELETITLPSERTATSGTIEFVTTPFTIFTTTEPPTTKATVLTPITIYTSTPEEVTLTYPSERTSTAPGNTVVLTTPFPSTVSTPTFSTVVVTPTTTILPNTTIPLPSNSTAPIIPVTGAASPNHKPAPYFVGAGMALLAMI